MTRIYLIRHAEAEGNLYRRAQGWYNGLITENGCRQIAALVGYKNSSNFYKAFRAYYHRSPRELSPGVPGHF